ncbi:hypothetical protein [Brevundimonas sp.]
MLTLAIALISASGGVQAQVSTPTDDGIRWQRTCSVERTTPHGDVYISRNFTDEGQATSGYGDFVHWTPPGIGPGARAQPLDMRFSYFWQSEDATPFRTREMEIKITMRLDQPMPSIGLLRVIRPFPIEGFGVADGPALTTEIFGNGSHDPQGGHGNMPLGDLLAYAEEYETLDWMINRFSEVNGYGLPLARGKVDLRGFREALAALPDMRDQLDIQASDVMRNCERRLHFEPPPHP